MFKVTPLSLEGDPEVVMYASVLPYMISVALTCAVHDVTMIDPTSLCKTLAAQGFRDVSHPSLLEWKKISKFLTNRGSVPIAVKALNHLLGEIETAEDRIEKHESLEDLFNNAANFCAQLAVA